MFLRKYVFYIMYMHVFGMEAVQQAHIHKLYT